MSSLIRALLTSLDAVGIQDGSMKLDRCHAMFTVHQRLLTEDDLILVGTSHSPEAFGSDAFGRINVMIPPDREFAHDERIHWIPGSTLPPVGQKLWFFDLLDLDCPRCNPMQMSMCYCYDLESSWAVVPMLTSGDDILRCAELFAGGFGGWSASLDVLTAFNSQKFSVLAVEHDMEIAKTYAASRKATLVPANTNLSDLDLTQGHWIVHKSVTDPDMKALLTSYQPHFLCISAPCPPWSTASRSPGLGSDDGQLLPQALGLLRWIRAPVVLIEQVAGFRQHQHFAVIGDLLKMLGYSLAWHKIVDLAQHSQTTRTRWLGLAVRVQASLHLCPFQMWPSSEEQHPCVIDLPPSHFQELHLTPQVIQVAGDFRFVKNPLHTMSRESTNVLNSRIYGSQDQLPTFMARYGSQHEFAESYLAEYGYFGFFKADASCEHGCRFFSPAEVAAIHGVWDQTFLPMVNADAWLVIGNQIAVPHALLMTANACRFLGVDLEVKEVFEFYHHHKVQPDAATLHVMPGGYMLTHADATIPSETHEAVADLWAQRVFDNGQYWTWNHGVCDLIPPQGSDVLPVTAVSVYPTQSDAADDQVPATCLKAHIHFGEKFQEFWFSTTLNALDVESIWSQWFSATFSVATIPAMHLRVRDEPGRIDSLSRPFLLASVAGQISVLPCDLDRPMLEQVFDLGLPQDIRDPFGHVGMWQKPSHAMMLMDFDLHHGSMHTEFVIFVCALNIVELSWGWDPRNDALTVSVATDDPTARVTFFTALGEALPTDQLRKTGRVWAPTVDPAELSFVPETSHRVIPVPQFRLCLAVAFTRMCLDAMEKACLQTNHLPSDIRQVKIEFADRLLWKGTLPSTTTIAALCFLLQKTLASQIGSHKLRILQRFEPIAHDTTLYQCEFSPLHNAVSLTILVERHGGGAKNQIRLAQQTALASSLLDRGFPLSWVTKTVDRIVSRNNLQRLQAATSKPPGQPRQRAIDELLAEAGIAPPEVEPPATRMKQPGLPWSKAKKPRLDASHIDVASYTLVEGFFSNQDDTEAGQIAELRPQATGICLMQQAQATQWTCNGATISSDELAILVPGRFDAPSGLESASITFPCYNDAKEMVLLNGTIIQLGVKAVKHKQGQVSPVQPSAHLVSFTMFQEDWNEQEWKRILDQPQAFLKEKLAQNQPPLEVQALWGKSLRAKGGPASPAQAQSVQLHGTVEDAKLHRLLQASGFNRIWTVPKAPDGRVDAAYRVIWIDGDQTQATCLSARLPDCLGLVKGKTSQNYGLRFASDKHAEAWKVIHPNEDVPKIQTGTNMFKVEGLPFGCSVTALQQWANHISWDACPFRALGPTTWLFKADGAPPAGIHLYNSSPVLIRLLPPRNQATEKVILGRPSKPMGSDPWQSGKDPWHSYTGTASVGISAPAPSGPRSTQGPVEVRFQAQDAKIEALQTELANMAKCNEQKHQETKQHMIQLDNNQKQHHQEVDHALRQIKTDLDQALANTMKTHSNRMDSKFDELKKLMIATGKRRESSPQEDDFMQGSDWGFVDTGAFALQSSQELPAPDDTSDLCYRRCVDHATSIFHAFDRTFVRQKSNGDMLCDRWPTFDRQTEWLPPQLLLWEVVMRHGEASHPGPSALPIRTAITNPTSIVSKQDTYRELQKSCHADLITASETAATGVAQSIFGKSIRNSLPYQTWSNPVQDHVVRSDGAPSLRGKAGGTCILTTLPMRKAIDTIPHHWAATTRIVHSVVNVGKIQIQFVAVYCLPSNRSGAAQFNSDLIHVALDAMMQLPIPSVLLGDFNGNPLEWQCGERLRQLGFLSLDSRYHTLYGEAMPPTCKDATTVDQAFVSLQLHTWVTRITVEQVPYFDTHKVVCFDITVPTSDIQMSRYTLPKTFVELDVDSHTWKEHFAANVTDHPPSSLQQWGQCLEASLDLTLRHQHEIDPWTPKGLPRKYRGRCLIPKQKRVFLTTLTSKARPGDYQPTCEVHSRNTQQMVRQCVLDPVVGQTFTFPGTDSSSPS
eukprot:Skav221855  [mRNA]  locus=scaffold1175:104647:110856:+ [translate_table: standard]